MNIKKIISEIFQDMISEFKEGFDMVHFASLKSFKARLEYASRELSRIAEGSSRVAFSIDNTKVLKLAKNKKGLAQNETEGDEFLQSHYIDIIPKLFEQEPNDLWIVMEKADDVSKEQFKGLTGLDFYMEFYPYLAYAQRRNSPTNKAYMFKKEDDEKVRQILLKHPDLENSGFVRDLVQMIVDNDMSWGDYYRLNSYGVVHRGGKEMVVVRDFGLTEDTMNSLYGR